FEDVAALVALYRPGPMGTNMHNDYADRKNGRKPVSYYHADLEEILAPTYGLMIYQEQLMRVAQRLAGYSLGEADTLRKAAAKKKRDLMAKERSKFVDGCVANGHSAAFAEQMFNVIEPFADYSFPKAHATGYGFVAYQTAWLKANHPVEYLAALLTSVKSNKDQTAVFLNECRQLGIDVLVPDVNASESDFSVRPANPETGDAPAIHFGMSAVRNVGEGVVAQIVVAREEGGPFTDFYDFCDRVDPQVLNKRTIESLIKAGGFDSLDHPRQGLFQVSETILDTVIDRRRNEAEGQFDLFSALADAPGTTPVELGGGNRTLIPDTEFPKSQRLAFEKEMLGLYVSEHPMLGAERALRRYVDCSLTELRDAREGEMRSVGGVITALNRKYTRRGDLMGTFVLEDLAAALEVMVFPKTMAQYGHLLADDAIVVVKGRVDQRDDQLKVMAMEITRPELVLDGGPPVRIKVRINGLSDAKVTRLKELLSEHPGESPVFVHLESPEKTTVLRLGDEHLVDGGNGLFAELRVLLGADCIA
ncbi:MAG: DNA polymerase III subunit alpha, partial [Acidimicrobiia bacterium]